MPQVGFETTISAGELPQTYSLDREATGTGCKIVGLDESGSALDPVVKKLNTSGYIKAVNNPGDTNPQTQHC